MGWHIWTVFNDTHITADDRRRFNELASKNYHELYEQGDGPLEFDPDAMEHADYLNNGWATELLEEIKLNGTVIFTGDGEDQGKFWGYRFEDGRRTDLGQKDSLRVLWENAS